MYLHGSKLAFKQSFKPTMVNAALNFLFLKIIYSYRLQTTSNHFQPTSTQNCVQCKALRIHGFGLKAGLKVGLKDSQKQLQTKINYNNRRIDLSWFEAWFEG